jgi:hypothetical protein
MRPPMHACCFTQLLLQLYCAVPDPAAVLHLAELLLCLLLLQQRAAAHL